MVGAILAGGAGRRLASGEEGHSCAKAAVRLAGRPLLLYPLAVMSEVCGQVAVVCKRDTALPALGPTERWNEPDEPRHPVTGIVHALERAGGPVLVCAVDMPFVTAGECRELIATAGEGGIGVARGAPRRAPERASGAQPSAGRHPLAVVAVGDDRLEPLLAIYTPRALPVLSAAPPGAPLRATVEALDPLRVPLPAATLQSINTPADLRAAEQRLRAAQAQAGQPG